MIFVANRTFILFFNEVGLEIFAIAGGTLLNLCQMEYDENAVVIPQTIGLVKLLSILFIMVHSSLRNDDYFSLLRVIFY